MVHILSVSGYHVGLVAAMILLLLRLLKVPVRFTAPVTIPLLFFYAVMTGLGPAVLRSTLMVVLLLVARHLGRQSDWPTTLATCAGIILVINPLDLYDIGFQLSFVATWGLLYLTPVLNSLFHQIPKSIVLLITVPLAAQLATLPLVVLYFNLVSPVSILANLLTVHLVGLIMLFGGLDLLIGTIYLPLTGLLNGGIGFFVDLFIGLVQFCNSLPGASFFIPTPPLYLVFLYYVLLIAAFYLFQLPEERKKIVGSRQQMEKYKTFALISLLMITLWLVKPTHGPLEVHFIDVGQGDSALIITPGNQTVLVDTGGWQNELLTRRGAGEYVIVPYLHRLGINQVDALVLTHPHADHAGGARTLIETMPVGLVMVSPYGLQQEDHIDEGYTELLQEIGKQGIPLCSTRAGDELRLDSEVTMTCLGPGEKMIGTRSDANNNSLIFLLKYHERTVLLTGDIEAEAEKNLVENNKVSKIEILKVPHHGSGYFAPAFFQRVNPKAAIISVGKGNRFNHPSVKTLEALGEVNSKIYRTDWQGAIILTTDGAKWMVQTGK